MEEKIQVVRVYRRQENGMYDVPISGGESHAHEKCKLDLYQRK